MALGKPLNLSMIWVSSSVKIIMSQGCSKTESVWNSARDLLSSVNITPEWVEVTKKKNGGLKNGEFSTLKWL